MTLINNMRNAFATDASRDDADRGQLVEMVLIIAGFAIVAILAVNWIGTAIVNQGANVSACIEGAGTYNSNDAAKKCAAGDPKAAKNSYTKQSGYSDRFKDAK